MKELLPTIIVLAQTFLAARPVLSDRPTVPIVDHLIPDPILFYGMKNYSKGEEACN